MIKQWILRWLREDKKAMRGLEIATTKSRDYEDISDYRNVMKFEIVPARGGMIFTIRTYDEKSDNHKHLHYVIHDDEDVSARIGEIVSLEMLRR